MLQDRLELSERRACRVTGQHRSTQRRLPVRGCGDDALRRELHAFSRRHPRWGYRRAWATLREEGWGVNRKRVQRLWREEGLRVPVKRRKRQRLGDSAQPARRLRAERPNHAPTARPGGRGERSVSCPECLCSDGSAGICRKLGVSEQTLLSTKEADRRSRRG